MTILITGSSSYLGKELIQYLEFKKKKYIGIDLAKAYNKNCLKLNILDEDLHKKIKKKNIKAIVHLAAISNKNDCERNIIRCYDVNLLGTINILNFAKQKKIKKIIFASSEWVYESIKSKKLNSEIKIPIKFSNHYTFSKILCENVIRMAKIDYTILRFGIIYGKRNRKIFSAVESIIDQYLNKNKIIVNSKKTARKYIYIDDVINSIFVVLSKNYFKKKIVDVQGPKLVNFKEIVDILNKKFSLKKKIIEQQPKNFSIRDIKKTNENNSFLLQAKINIKDGIDKIINELDEKKL